MTEQLNSGMSAWVMVGTGGPEVLQQQTLAIPQPGPGQVRIKVAGSGFNPLDTKLRSGVAAVRTESGIPGCDVSGVIDAIGEDVHLVPRFNVEPVNRLPGGNADQRQSG